MHYGGIISKTFPLHDLSMEQEKKTQSKRGQAGSSKTEKFALRQLKNQFACPLFPFQPSKVPISVEKEEKFIFSSGQYRIFLSNENVADRVFYNLLSGESRQSEREKNAERIYLDELDLTAITNRQNFIYLCHPENLPVHLPARDLIFFLGHLHKLDKNQIDSIFAEPLIQEFIEKKAKQLDAFEKGLILLTVADKTNFPIFLVNDITRRMPVEFVIYFKDWMEMQKEKGALVIYLTTETIIGLSNLNRAMNMKESEFWKEQVEGHRKK